jgi:hypothetical protein
MFLDLGAVFSIFIILLINPENISARRRRLKSTLVWIHVYLSSSVTLVITSAVMIGIHNLKSN